MRNVALAVIGGLVAALCFLAFQAGSVNGLILFWVAALPLFMVGLGVGIVEVMLASATGIAAVSWTLGPVGGAGFAAMTAMPATLLAILALGRFGKASRELSPGNLVMALGAIGILAFLLAVLATRHHPGGLQALMTQLLDKELATIGRVEGGAFPMPFAPATLAQWFPGVLAAVWLGMTVINGLLAQGLLDRFGWNRRASPGMAAIDLPRWSFLVLAAALAAAVWGKGEVAFIGLNVAIISALPVGLGGLAVIHCLASRVAASAMMLSVFYVTSILLAWSVPLVVVLGVIEQWVGLKRRIAKPAQGEV